MRFVFDIETDGFLEELTKIHCLVLKDIDSEQVYSFRPSQIREGLSLLAQAELLIGHNIIKFDLPAIRKLYPDFHTQAQIRDTIVCSRLIWTNLKERDFAYLNKHPEFPRQFIGKHSLEAWGYRLGLLKGEFHKEADWSRWSEAMQSYCEQDVEVTHRLWQKIQAKHYAEQAIQLEHDFAEIIFHQECHGFHFDVEAASELYGQLCQRRYELESELAEIFPPWEIRTTFIPKANNSKYGYQKGVATEKVKVIEFNPGSRDHIADRLMALRGWKPSEYTNEGKPKVDETILDELPWPEAKLLSEYLMLQKRIGQLAEGRQAWLKLEKNGRIYGRVNTNGAVTGRCTHHQPNIAQVPSTGVPYGKECRSLFTAPDGYCLVGADASGLELRCLAHYMGRFDGGAYAKELLEGDIHTTNQNAAGLPSRDDAKRFIYGFLYGAGDAKIGSIIGKGAKEGRKLKNKFLRKTPALKRLKEEITAKVDERGYLVGLDGRLLHVRSQHSALNTLLQSAGALLVKQATVFLYRELTEKGYVWGRDWAQVAHIHDEIQLQVRTELAEEVGTIAVRCFERAGEHFNFRCPITGEFKVGKTWAETH